MLSQTRIVYIYIITKTDSKLSYPYCFEVIMAPTFKIFSYIYIYKSCLWGHESLICRNKAFAYRCLPKINIQWTWPKKWSFSSRNSPPSEFPSHQRKRWLWLRKIGPHKSRQISRTWCSIVVPENNGQATLRLNSFWAWEPSTRIFTFNKNRRIFSQNDVLFFHLFRKKIIFDKM